MRGFTVLHRRLLKSICFALLFLFLGGLLVLGARGEGASQRFFFEYTIDRSALPAWVVHRELTLRIRVGDDADVRAWGDGVPLPVRYDETFPGTVLVTTAAERVLVGVEGESLPPDVGAYRVATLKEGKRWALSLTFDDGRLSVYENAFPELRRYGYRAGVAVIGRWLDDGDAHSEGYCQAEDLLDLLAHGWSVFNHSYSHYDSPSDISLEEMVRCQQAIQEHLQGYRPLVFTVPFTNALWEQIVNEHGAEVGIHLMQLYSESGTCLLPVDGPIPVGDTPFHLGRDDIKDWEEGDYFDKAHERAMAAPPEQPEHVWVSLHGHDISYYQPSNPEKRDWCALTRAMAYLYHTYGAGGTDEVWVAPADEVFQYLVVRSLARVSGREIPARDWGPALHAPMLVAYSGDPDKGWKDTFIQEWYPTENFAGAVQLRLRGGGQGRSSILLQLPITPPAEGVVVQKALLSLYATSSSNPAGMEVFARRLLRPWKVAEATWWQAEEGSPWAEPGAQGEGLDKQREASDRVRVGGCEGEGRWYAFDITDIVAYWLAHPEENYGLLIEGQLDIAKEIRFASSEYHDRALRPRLRVLYAWPTPQPTPTPTSFPTVAPSPTPLGLSVYLPLIFR